MYWGGGSVSGSLCDARWQKPKTDLSARLEDGTVNFLSIAAIKYGFAALQAREQSGALLQSYGAQQQQADCVHDCLCVVCIPTCLPACMFARNCGLCVHACLHAYLCMRSSARLYVLACQRRENSGLALFRCTDSPAWPHRCGSDCSQAIGMERIERHVAALTRHLYRSLKALRHRNGANFALLYWARSEEPSGKTDDSHNQPNCSLAHKLNTRSLPLQYRTS